MAAFRGELSGLLEFMRKKNVHLPAWLDQTQIPANPWTSRAEFRRNSNSPQMKELRQFSARHRGGADAIHGGAGARCDGEDPQDDADGTEREHIVIQFTRGDFAPPRIFIRLNRLTSNFKGEGTNPNEAA